MKNNQLPEHGRVLPKLATQSIPVKALVTAIVLTMAVAMLGAWGQIVIHDIVPTFFAEKQGNKHADHQMAAAAQTQDEKAEDFSAERDKLSPKAFAKGKAVEGQPFYKTEQFIWTLKWSHIHLFGMNLIFIFMGAIAVFLDLTSRSRTWLIILPFAGVLIDIAAMWLRAYISPVFFWLHLPGGGLFGFVFVFVTLRALWEMWRPVSIKKK